MERRYASNVCSLLAPLCALLVIASFPTPVAAGNSLRATAHNNKDETNADLSHTTNIITDVPQERRLLQEGQELQNQRRRIQQDHTCQDMFTTTFVDNNDIKRNCTWLSEQLLVDFDNINRDYCGLVDGTVIRKRYRTPLAAVLCPVTCKRECSYESEQCKDTSALVGRPSLEKKKKKCKWIKKSLRRLDRYCSKEEGVRSRGDAACPKTCGKCGQATVLLSTETSRPSKSPTTPPTNVPTSMPSGKPTSLPSNTPTVTLSASPSSEPSRIPSASPTAKGSQSPSSIPSQSPTEKESSTPSSNPTATPSFGPTLKKSDSPSAIPSETQSQFPSVVPTFEPSESASNVPSGSPSAAATEPPTLTPTSSPMDTAGSPPGYTGQCVKYLGLCSTFLPDLSTRCCSGLSCHTPINQCLPNPRQRGQPCMLGGEQNNRCAAQGKCCDTGLFCEKTLKYSLISNTGECINAADRKTNPPTIIGATVPPTPLSTPAPTSSPVPPPTYDMAQRAQDRLATCGRQDIPQFDFENPKPIVAACDVCVSTSECADGFCCRWTFAQLCMDVEKWWNDQTIEKRCIP